MWGGKKKKQIWSDTAAGGRNNQLVVCCTGCPRVVVISKQPHVARITETLLSVATAAKKEKRKKKKLPVRSRTESLIMRQEQHCKRRRKKKEKKKKHFYSASPFGVGYRLYGVTPLASPRPSLPYWQFNDLKPSREIDDDPTHTIPARFKGHVLQQAAALPARQRILNRREQKIG